MTISKIGVPFFIKGKEVLGSDVDFGDFTCPKLDLDDLVWSRSEQGPAFDLPISDIVDFLVEVGKALNFDHSRLLQEALEHSLAFNTLNRRILENSYGLIAHFFDRAGLDLQIDQDTGRDALDGWKEVTCAMGTRARVRAFPPRLAHITAGNTPAVAATTIVRGALSKGVHLLKMPANDLFTATAILRTMALVDANHPTTKSFSAVYWRGGDKSIESPIMRSQFFDKLVVWGGGQAVEGALRYAAPGFEIVSFDPKVSVSMIGRQVFESPVFVRDAARRAATDIALFNQDACAASRFLYIEGKDEEVDGFCEVLAEELRVERLFSSEFARPIAPETQEEIEVLRNMEPIYRVWGDYSGAGLVIRSDEPVDFHPMSKTVNVVIVDSLSSAVRHATVATQTAGIYPAARATELRNALASRGVQRIAALGEVIKPQDGLPHDGFYPLTRVMRWVLEDAQSS
jgi:hypothetical protein